MESYLLIECGNNHKGFEYFLDTRTLCYLNKNWVRVAMSIRG